ncbi:MAG: nitroreductase family protein [Clostridia bacterium]|nr:nitroreductase family protein [Clostridia bacterium]
MFETKLEARWFDAVQTRQSVRKYTAPPTDEELSRLGSMARQLSWQGVRIVLLKGPGLKGAIKGTDVYATIIATKDAPKELEGYAGEALTLECASLGLGSCWLGGGFYKSVVKIAAKPKDNEHITCVLAIGRCGKLSPPRHKRKPLASTCGMSDAQRAELPAWQRSALECAALAPSAMNRQPWRLAVTPGSLQVLDGGGNFGYGPVDRGIAMLHVAVGAMHAGAQGIWRPVDKGWEFKAK